MSVYSGVQRDLEALGEDLAQTGLAQAALALALELDNSENSATSKSMCAKALLDTMAEIRELVPKDQTKDGVDELQARRARRAAVRSATAAD